MWMKAQREAIERQAKELGHGDVADYLRLRQINDAARQIGMNWLFDTFMMVAAEANRRGFAIEIKKSAPDDLHVFTIGSATMRGDSLRLQAGIRSLTVEAGFPRLPQDGFVRGNGLAAARIIHFGKASVNDDLLLVRSNSGNSSNAQLKTNFPIWFVLDKNNLREQFSVAHLKNHFAIFLDQN